MQPQGCRKSIIARHFAQPRGVLGWLAGQLMAHRASNRARNRWTLELLGIEPRHRVLELGCGPGWALSLACELAREGRVVGVDHSATMLSQARKRNRGAIARGTLRLIEADVAALPDELGGPFDRVYSSNVVGFLSEPAAVFAMLRKQMAPGGLIATTWLPRMGPKTDEAVHAQAGKIEQACQKADLAPQRQEFLRIDGVLACCVIGERKA